MYIQLVTANFTSVPTATTTETSSFITTNTTKRHVFSGETLKSVSGANEDEPLRSISRGPGCRLGLTGADRPHTAAGARSSVVRRRASERAGSRNPPCSSRVHTSIRTYTLRSPRGRHECPICFAVSPPRSCFSAVFGGEI